MISNEHQARITRKQIRNFETALDRFEEISTTTDPILRQAERASIESQLESLKTELAEYLALATQKEITINSLAELPAALVKARIACRLSQGELAKLVGLKTQAIQRYESDFYARASIDRLLEIASSMGLIFTGAFGVTNSKVRR